MKAPTCQDDPLQYEPSEVRRRVNDVLLAFKPTPPLLSAALPLKMAGTVAARKLLPAGVVTEAVVGGVQSLTV